MFGGPPPPPSLPPFFLGWPGPMFNGSLPTPSLNWSEGSPHMGYFMPRVRCPPGCDVAGDQPGDPISSRKRRFCDQNGPSGARRRIPKDLDFAALFWKSAAKSRSLGILSGGIRAARQPGDTISFRNPRFYYQNGSPGARQRIPKDVNFAALFWKSAAKSRSMGILSGGLQAARQSQPGRAKMCPILLNPGFSKIGSIFAGLAWAGRGKPGLALGQAERKCALFC